MVQIQIETGNVKGMSVEEQLDNFKKIYSIECVGADHDGQGSEESEQIQNYCDGCGKSNWHSGLCWTCENEMFGG